MFLSLLQVVDFSIKIMIKIKITMFYFVPLRVIRGSNSFSLPSLSYSHPLCLCAFPPPNS